MNATRIDVTEEGKPVKLTVRGATQPGRALRTARIIAARFLCYRRDLRAKGIDPRSITVDGARDAFRMWDRAGHVGFRSWPKSDLKLACKAAAALITRQNQPHSLYVESIVTALLGGR